jgi:hypothetical protein
LLFARLVLTGQTYLVRAQAGQPRSLNPRQGSLLFARLVLTGQTYLVKKHHHLIPYFLFTKFFACNKI